MAFAANAGKTKVVISDEETSPPTRDFEFSRYAELIRRCGDAKALMEGKRLHARLSRLQLDKRTFISNLLIEMYSKCGSVLEASAVFEAIETPNIFSWTIMISAYAQNGHPLQSLVLFRKMELEGTKPNKVTFLEVLSACSALGDLSEANRFRERLVHSSDCSVDLLLATALINMFGKCGSVEDAEQEFERLQTKCIIAWNAMLTAYTQNGHHEEAVELYQEMVLEGMKADTVTFLTILSAFFTPHTLELGRIIHLHAVALGLEQTTIVGNCLVNMYGKCESLVDARLMFERIPVKNVFSWAIMISAYVQNSHAPEAEALFHSMDLEGIKPDTVTFVNLVGAFASSDKLTQGRAVHGRISSLGLESDVFVGTAVVNMYAKAGKLTEARDIFARMEKKRDPVLWNALIASYAQSGEGQSSLKLYLYMSQEGVSPNQVTYASVLDACSVVGGAPGLEQGREVVKVASSRGLDSSLVFKNSLVNMFGKCGSLAEARRAFDEMEDRNVVSWTGMIEAYVEHGYNREGLVMFEQMDFDVNVEANEFTFSTVLCACSSLGAVSEVKKIHARCSGTLTGFSTVVGSALVTAYGSCGCLDEAWDVFNQMNERSVVTWNAMIEACIMNGMSTEGVKLFRRMEVEGVKPSSITFAIVLKACCKLDMLELGRWIHRRALDSGYEVDEVLGVSLVEMYGKLASLQEARDVFDRINWRDYTAWNALIAANAHQGDVKGVVSVFHEMHLEGLEPNQGTFERLLTACTHSGLLDRAWEQFIYMREDYGIEQARKHYNSMVGLLARAGSVDEAQHLAANMPFKPGMAVWKMLLHACEMHGNQEGGESAASMASGIQPRDAVPYVLLSNLYARSS